MVDTLITDSQARLWAKLAQEVGILGDIRILLAEYWKNFTQLEYARGKHYAIPQPSLPFTNWEEREAYFKAVNMAKQARAHIAALEETTSSLVEQLAMMTEGLTIEEITEFITKIEGGNNETL